MTVYTFDIGIHNLVKIEKHGKKWCVYRLEKVVLTKVEKIKFTIGDKEYPTMTVHPRFIFEQKPYESWSYQPFEDKDIKGDPEAFLEDIKRWQPHLVCH